MEAGGEGRWPRVLGSLLCQVSLDRAGKVTPLHQVPGVCFVEDAGFSEFGSCNDPHGAFLCIEGGTRARLAVISLYSTRNPLG